MLCFQTLRLGPDNTYAERGSSGCSYTRLWSPVPRWNRIAHPDPNDTPTTSPNAGASRCHPMPAPGG